MKSLPLEANIDMWTYSAKQQMQKVSTERNVHVTPHIWMSFEA